MVDNAFCLQWKIKESDTTSAKTAHLRKSFIIIIIIIIDIFFASQFILQDNQGKQNVWSLSLRRVYFIAAQ